MPQQRRKNRLMLDCYRGGRAYFITITTAERRPLFIHDSVVSYHLDILSRSLDKHGFVAIAYCYMPDHVHLLVIGKNQSSDLIALVKDYKQRTGYDYRKQTGGVLWQKSFYDHVIRKEESLRKVIFYILANPVRREMVDRPRDYAYAGSLVYGQAIFDDFM